MDNLDNKVAFNSLTSINRLKPVNRHDNNKRFKNLNKHKKKKKEENNEHPDSTDTSAISVINSSDLDENSDKKVENDGQLNRKLIDIKI